MNFRKNRQRYCKCNEDFLNVKILLPFIGATDFVAFHRRRQGTWFLIPLAITRFVTASGTVFYKKANGGDCSFTEE